jgi:hypothetical protein
VLEGLFLGLILGLIQLWIGFISQHYPALFNIGNKVLFGLAVLLAVFVVGGGITLTLQWINDWLRWRKWLKDPHKPMNFQELCDLVNQYHYASFCTQALKVVRQQKILVRTYETVESLKQLALKIEAKQRADNQNKKTNPDSHSDGVEAKDLSNCTKLISRANPEMIDELYILLEDTNRAIENQAN